MRAIPRRRLRLRLHPRRLPGFLWIKACRSRIADGACQASIWAKRRQNRLRAILYDTQTVAVANPGKPVEVQTVSIQVNRNEKPDRPIALQDRLALVQINQPVLVAIDEHRHATDSHDRHRCGKRTERGCQDLVTRLATGRPKRNFQRIGTICDANSKFPVPQ